MRGSVKYEMRLVFKRCNGENPASCGAADREGSCEFVESGFFINVRCKNVAFADCECGVNRDEKILQQTCKRRVSDAGGINRRFNLVILLITCQGKGILRASVAILMTVFDEPGFAGGGADEEENETCANALKRGQCAETSGGMSGRNSDGKVGAVVSKILTS